MVPLPRIHLFAYGGELAIAKEGALEARVPFPPRVARLFGSVRYAKRLVADISGLAILVRQVEYPRELV